MLAKILLILTIVLQLSVAIAEQGWIRSAAEFSAFLLVIVLAILIQAKRGESTTSPTMNTIL
ncbi:hypothetical protein LDJ79_11915 [Vibrio tritonius]|uniref:O-succinylbenzoic acid--CoA ligase n=1 Tax=Vibrio tritonius TaxID=1435069 RepID=A0ABS7YPL4_9VIBR|nr:hypothetical protein [Vibrio tritonius]MCA2016821.1 hypothetical protein [Vibrio tritonius]